MIDVTHTQNGAWDKVWQGGAGKGQPIPYALGVPDEDPSKPILLEVAREQAMFEAANAAELL